MHIYIFLPRGSFSVKKKAFGLGGIRTRGLFVANEAIYH